MVNPIDIIIHLDKYLGTIIQTYGTATYLILFFIIFCETGLVFLPFLPGDSLIFVAGAFASTGVINVFILFIILSIAAILGDSVNYSIGKYFGERFFLKRNWIKKENLERTKEFFEKHGGKTIIIARFIPIIRSFAPFVAGVGKMKYIKFLTFNITGAVLWTASILTLGYYFGSIPFIKNNLSLIIILIIIISFIPPSLAWAKHRRKNKIPKF